MQRTTRYWGIKSLALARQAALSGTLSSLLSTWVLATRGRRDGATAYGPLNAPSHWLFGEEALQADRPSWRHTFTGLLIHQGSSMLWGLIYDRLICKRRQAPSMANAVAGAIGVTAVAALVDFTVVPSRFTPGFEHRLSAKSLALTYGAFAVGLAISGILLSKRR